MSNTSQGSPIRRCVLITNGNLASMVALADWLDLHADKLVKVYVTYKLPSSKNNLQGILSLIRSSGTRYTWLKIWINRIAPYRLRMRGLPASVQELLALRIPGIEVEEVDSVNTAAVVEEVIGLNVDLLVSFSATQRFGKPLLAAPKAGAINVHYGELPKYAGLSPYFWHLYNGEGTFGVTLHRIEPRLDAGPILEQVVRPIGTDRSCLGVLLKMAAEVSPLLNRYFEGGCDNSAARAQDLTERSYFGHPSRTQSTEFFADGNRMSSRSSRSALFKRVQDIARGA